MKQTQTTILSLLILGTSRPSGPPPRRKKPRCIHGPARPSTAKDFRLTSSEIEAMAQAAIEDSAAANQKRAQTALEEEPAQTATSANQAKRWDRPSTGFRPTGAPGSGQSRPGKDFKPSSRYRNADSSTPRDDPTPPSSARGRDVSRLRSASRPGPTRSPSPSAKRRASSTRDLDPRTDPNVRHWRDENDRG
jgi:hypothetical protein